MAIKEVDITKTGPKKYRELQDANMQEFVSESGYNPEEDPVIQEFTSNFKPILGNANPYWTTEKTIEAPEGFGESRYDPTNITVSGLEHWQDIRANNQPGIAKIGAGVAKGAVTAATTFADGVIGTPVGILNVLAHLGDIHSVEDAFGYFINNYVSTSLQQVNEFSEKVLPNYYTEAEQNGPWYNHILSANFIGDKFLKNLGFVIGAAYSGRLSAGLLGEALGLSEVRNAFKGAVTTGAGKVLKNSDDIYKAYKAGDAFMDGVKLTDDLGKAAKKLKNAEYGLRIAGSISSAMGEGRIEAISNTQDWFDLHKSMLDDNYQQSMTAARQQLWKDHPEYFSLVTNGDGSSSVELTDPRGIAAMQELEKQLKGQYDGALKKLSEDRVKMANRIFAANVALLAPGNLFSLGRFFSGGYTSGKMGKALAKGSIKEGFSVNKRPIVEKYVEAGLVPFIEGNEEMAQAAISESTGQKYASELNNFLGYQLDPDASEETISWMNAVDRGLANTYGNIDRWEEGFLGFITGALGMPHVSTKVNSKGKKRPRLTMEGELWQNIKDAREMSKNARDITTALNARIKDPNFINYYRGVTGHIKGENDKEEALRKGDQFSFKNSEQQQFVNDAIMFDRAGRIQDFYDFIEEAGNVSDDDVKTIRELTSKKDGSKSIFDDMSDEEVKQHIRKQAEDSKKRLDKYVKINGDIRTLYGEKITSDNLAELTWMMTQIDDWEDRTKSILGDIRSQLQDKAKELKERFGIDVETDFGNLESLISSVSSEDSKNVIDEINKIIKDKNLSIEEQRQRIEAAIKSREKAAALLPGKLGRDVNHIRALAKKKRKALQEKIKRLNEGTEPVDQSKRKEALDELFNQFNRELNEWLAAERFEGSTLEAYNRTVEKFRIAGENYVKGVQSIEELFDELELAEQIFLDQIARQQLSNLEGRRGESTWEKQREAAARSRFEKERGDLFSQIIALKEQLESPDNTLINPISIQKISEQLIDLIKIYAARSRFLDRYNQLSKNPSLFTEEGQKEIENINTYIKNKVADETLKGMKEVKTVGDLRKAVADIDDDGIIDIILDKFSKQNDDNAELVRNFKELTKYANSLADVLEDMPQDKEGIRESLANIINDALEHADTAEEAKQIIENAIPRVSKEIGDAIKKVLDKVKENEESEKAATSEDERASEKKVKEGIVKKVKRKVKEGVKKVRKTFSITDDGKDSAEEIAEEEEKESKGTKEEPGKRTGKADLDAGKKAILRDAKNKLNDMLKRVRTHISLAEEEGVEEALKVALEQDIAEGDELVKNIKAQLERLKRNTPSESIDSLNKWIDQFNKSIKELNELLNSADEIIEEYEKDSSSNEEPVSLTLEISKSEAVIIINNTVYKLGKEIDDKIANASPSQLEQLRKDFRDKAKKELEDAKAETIERSSTLSAKEKQALEDFIDEKIAEANKTIEAHLTRKADKKYDNTPLSIKRLEQMSNDELIGVIDNSKDPKEKELAQKILDDRKRAKGGNQAEGTNSETNNPQNNNEPRLRSWYHTKYRFAELKGKDRRAVIYDSEVVEALDELGAYDFVDKGNLGVLFNEDSDIPIHYVKVKDDRLDNVIVLAIEVTPEVKKLLGESEFENSFIAQDGKRYQAVGALSANPNDTVAIKSYDNIVSNINDELDEYNDTEPDYFVSKQTNKIKHIYSGRMVKSTDSPPYDKVEQRPLHQVIGNEKVVLGITYGNEAIPRVPALDVHNETIVPLNPNNKNSRSGAVWLMVKEADGRWYAKAVKVKRFTESEYSLDDYGNTQIINDIFDLLKIIVDPDQSDYDRAIAKYSLKSILYFPEDIDIAFNKDSVSIVGFKNDVVRKEGDLDDKARDLFKILQDEALNLRFQVDTSRLNDESYVRELISSEVLTTDLAMIHNVNASFDLYLVDAKGDIIETKEKKTGHTGRRGINNSSSSRTVTLNGKTYYKSDDGIVDNKGNKITDQDRIDEINLMEQILLKRIKPIEGSKTLYLGVYSNSKGEFGISGNHVVTGEKLEELKKNAADNVRCAKRKRALQQKRQDKDDLNYEDDPNEERQELFYNEREDKNGDLIIYTLHEVHQEQDNEGNTIVTFTVRAHNSNTGKDTLIRGRGGFEIEEKMIEFRKRVDSDGEIVNANMDENKKHLMNRLISDNKERYPLRVSKLEFRPDGTVIAYINVPKGNRDYNSKATRSGTVRYVLWNNKGKEFERLFLGKSTKRKSSRLRFRLDMASDTPVEDRTSELTGGESATNEELEGVISKLRGGKKESKRGKNSSKTEPVNATKDKDETENPLGNGEEASEEEYLAVLNQLTGGKNAEGTNKTAVGKRPRKANSSNSAIIGETLRGDEKSLTELQGGHNNFSSIARSSESRKALKEMGINSIKEAEDLLNKHGIKPETITSQEEFNGAIKKAKCK